MKLTFLGTGTSQGVPVIGCRCAVCTSDDRRDRRLRTSAMVETRGVRLIIDAGPDFRYQMLRTGVRHIDGILLTHEHKDHIGGLDDVRAFNFVDYPPTIHRVDIYAAPRTLACVRKDFDYAFEQDKYRGVPEIELHEIDVARPFTVCGVEIIPVSGHHSERFTVTGYRIGPLAYLTDFKTIEDAEVEKLAGVDTWWSMPCVSRNTRRISTWRRLWRSSGALRRAWPTSRTCRTRSAAMRRRSRRSPRVCIWPGTGCAWRSAERRANRRRKNNNNI